MGKSLLDRDNNHCGRLFPFDGESAPKFRIGANPRPAIHAICFVCAGNKENQSDLRVLSEILEAIDLIIASPIRDKQRAPVFRDLHEAGLVALGRAVKAVLASRGHNQKRRSIDESPADRINVVKRGFDDPLSGWRVN
jgi:hypothetical protein